MIHLLINTGHIRGNIIMIKASRKDLNKQGKGWLPVRSFLFVAILGSCFSSNMVYARPASAVFKQVLPVNDTTLDRMRGGFFIQGMNYSIGITSATYINGALVGTQEFYSSLQSQITKITSGSTSVQSTKSGTVSLTQVGAGNSSSLNLQNPPHALLTEIQNTMNNVLIQHYTGLNLAITHAANTINFMTTNNRISSIGFFSLK